MAGAARCGFSVLAVLTCAGPVLIVIGVVLLSDPNSRSRRISDYNGAVNAYNRFDAPFLAQATVRLGSQTLTRANEPIAVAGNADGVKKGIHYTFTGRSPRLANDRYSLVVSSAANPATGNQTVPFTVPYVRTVDRELHCDEARCSADCGNSQFTCGAATMRAYCESSFNGAYSSHDGACRSGAACGTCRYTGNLAEACLVVAITNDGNVAPSNKYTSCFFPFTRHEYLPQAASAVVTVVSERDPIIELQRLTAGTNDFGVTASQQRNMGLIMLGIGAGITIVFAVASVVFIRRQQRQHEKRILNAGPLPMQQPYAIAIPYGEQPFESDEPYEDEGGNDVDPYGVATPPRTSPAMKSLEPELIRVQPRVDESDPTEPCSTARPVYGSPYRSRRR